MIHRSVSLGRNYSIPEAGVPDMPVELFTFFFFFSDPPPTEISSLSLHDALPICLDVLPANNQVVLTAKLGTNFFYRRPHFPGILFLAEVREWLIDERCFVQTSFGTGRSLQGRQDRKSTRLNSSHGYTSYAVFCLK